MHVKVNLATDRLVHVIIRVCQHGKDPYRDTPTSVYLNKCKQKTNKKQSVFFTIQVENCR